MMCSNESKATDNNCYGSDGQQEEEQEEYSSNTTTTTTSGSKSAAGDEATRRRKNTSSSTTNNSMMIMMPPDECQFKPAFYSHHSVVPTSMTMAHHYASLPSTTAGYHQHQDQHRRMDDDDVGIGDHPETEASSVSGHNNEESTVATALEPPSSSHATSDARTTTLLTSKNKQVRPSSTTATTTTTAVKPPSNKDLFKKAPTAPKQSNSAYIHFAGAMQKKIRAMMRSKSIKERTANICKVVADSWKKLSAEEREPWETMAREDRARYDREKAEYKGPWRIPKWGKSTAGAASGSQTMVHRASVKPKSSFSLFSKARRAQLKRDMPNATKEEIAEALSNLWDAASPSIKEYYQTASKQSYAIELNEVKLAERRMQQQQQQQQQLSSEKRLCLPTRSSVPSKSFHNRSDGISSNEMVVEPPPSAPTRKRHYDDETTTQASPPSNENHALTKRSRAIMVVAEVGSPMMGYRQNSHQCNYVAYDNPITEDQQELFETFFYPDYLREAILHATKEYEKAARAKLRYLPQHSPLDL